MKNTLTLGGTFSGIGGFELAAIWAGIVPIWSTDIDQNCCDDLRRNFDHRVLCADIKNINHEELESVDIICGGDPCQPSSRAGLGKGASDDRFLWSEMFRLVQSKHPTFVLNENVDGTITNGILDGKINDLEREGYTCQSYIIPAEAVGAFHRRDRVWLVAYDTNCILYSSRQSCNENGIKKQKGLCKPFEPVNLWPLDSYADTKRLKEQYNASESSACQEGLSRYFGFGSSPHGHNSRDILESGLMGMLDGVSEGLDYPNRYKRIAALGNSIVPQVAYEFFRWMKIIID